MIMRTQDQTKKLNWYKKHGILIVLIVIYYLFLGYLGLKSDNSNTSIWSYPWWAIAMIAPVFFSLIYLYFCLCQENKQKTHDMVFGYQKFANRLDDKIEEAIQIVDIRDNIKLAITDSLNNNKSLVNEAIKEGLQKALNDSSVMSEVINTFVKGTLDTETIVQVVQSVLKDNDSLVAIKGLINSERVIKTAVNEAVTKNNMNRAIEVAMKNERFVKAVRSTIENKVQMTKFSDGTLEGALKGAIKDKLDVLEEIEANKYRFIKGIVEDICKNKDIKEGQIDSIRGIIDDILKVPHIGIVKNETDKIVSWMFIDVNGRNFEVKFNKNESKIESVAPNGEYRITNKIGLEIKDNKIKDIKIEGEKGS